MKLVDKLRASDVDRWHIVKTTTRQSLAEHLFNVAMIAEELNRRLWHQKDHDGAYAFEGENHRDGSHLLTLCWSLYHDLPEVLTGDIPTPYKPFINEKVDVGIMLDGHYRDTKLLVENTYIEAVVKIADLLEGIRFLKYNKCDSYGNVAQHKLEEIVDRVIKQSDTRYSQFDWFKAVREVIDSMTAQPTQLDHL